MKHWPAILSAAVAVTVAVPVAQRFLPDIGLWTSNKDHHAKTKLLSLTQLQRVQVSRMQVRDDGAFAPAPGLGLARLTLDSKLQRKADASLQQRGVERGAVLLLDLKRGRMLAYASRAFAKERSDPRTTATSPAGDLFELVTSAALMQVARLKPSSKTCYRDPGKWLTLDDLKPDPARDIWCPTLAEAQARNLTPLFARLAVDKLPARTLMAFSSSYGFGAPVRFEQPVQPSVVRVPRNGRELLDTAVGRKRTSLSPVHALTMVATVATGGVLLAPRLIDQITTPAGKVLYQASNKPRVVRRALRTGTAKQLARTMADTTEIGKAFSFFHDETSHPILDVQVASKVGVVNRPKVHERTTWFAGFAPASEPTVALVVLSVGSPSSKKHAAAIAVEILDAYFTKGAKHEKGQHVAEVQEADNGSEG